MRTCLLALFTVFVLGCASSGPRIDASRLSEIRKGETTASQVVASFGRPSVRSKNIDGTETALYLYAAGRSDAAAFVPMVSALIGKADADVDSVVFRFDDRGVLSDYRITRAKPSRPSVSVSPPVAAPAVDPGNDKAPPPRAAASTRPADHVSPDWNPWTIQLYPSGYRENR